jgi:hypothetical protein
MEENFKIRVFWDVKMFNLVDRRQLLEKPCDVMRFYKILQSLSGPTP